MEKQDKTVGEALVIAILAALLGLLLLANSLTAPRPLAIADVALGAIFILTATYQAIFK